MESYKLWRAWGWQVNESTRTLIKVRDLRKTRHIKSAFVSRTEVDDHKQRAINQVVANAVDRRDTPIAPTRAKYPNRTQHVITQAEYSWECRWEKETPAGQTSRPNVSNIMGTTSAE